MLSTLNTYQYSIMEKLSVKKIAQEFSKINWATVQSDCQHENEKVTQLIHQIEESDISKEQTIRLFVKILEAVTLDIKYNKDPESPFIGMVDFDYINLNNYPTNDYKI